MKNERAGAGESPLEGWPLILGYLGVILMLIGGVILLPLVVLAAYPEEAGEAKYFVLPGTAAILIGYMLGLHLRGREHGRLHKHQDTVIVVGAWALAILLCAAPFVLTGRYNFTQAVFECTSGWSTTGLSVVDVTQTPHIFLLYRSVMLFFGGVGLVLVMLCVLSDSYGMRLYSAEGHPDRLLPNLAVSARTILAIYAGYILAGTALYMVFGMDWFDALNHSIAALSTGGFSTRAESIGYYDSPAIELVTVLLMLLGSTNFLAHLYLLRGRLKNFFGYCEVRFSLFATALFTPLLAGLLLAGGLADALPRAVRDGLFQTVSCLTTTGFQSVPGFGGWPAPLLLSMILLMLAGGGTGSTAGGIKQFRVCIMLKDALWTLREKLDHRRVVRTHAVRRPDGVETLDWRGRSEVSSFILLYLMVFALGSFVLSCFGYPLADCMFEFSSALGTVGLSTGITAYDAPAAVLWTETAGMLLGRLEIYVVFLAVIRTAGDAKSGLLGALARVRKREWK